MKQYAMVVEADRCIGCKGGCQVACKTENEVALGRSRSTLYHMGPTGVYPDLQTTGLCPNQTDKGELFYG